MANLLRRLRVHLGQNLILNMNDHGFTVVAYNRTTSKVDEFLANEARGTRVIGVHSIEDLVRQLKRPRRVMLMVKAGKPVDEFIQLLLPHLEPGDILIDGGNSLFEDTSRRVREVEARGLLYIGTGVSGGEEGARHGPSIMPGGSPAAWPHVKPIFQAVAAKVADGTPCCDWVGEQGAGHYVKMVHNGIEYGDMQLICEAYNIMKLGLGLSAGVLQVSGEAELSTSRIPVLVFTGQQTPPHLHDDGPDKPGPYGLLLVRAKRLARRVSEWERDADSSAHASAARDGDGLFADAMAGRDVESVAPVRDTLSASVVSSAVLVRRDVPMDVDAISSAGTSAARAAAQRR